MLQYLVDGGPVMVPIGLCSVVALAAFLERLWALRTERVIPSQFCTEFLELLRQERWGDAVALCQKWESAAVSRVVQIAVEIRLQPRGVIKERVEEVGRREAAEMERYVPVLGTIASIAPLLGLLGTVGGMILTFQVIEQHGATDIGNLAGGISQALLTTFAGLSVGIPAVVANRYLLARVDSHLIELEEVSLGVLELLEEKRGGESA